MFRGDNMQLKILPTCAADQVALKLNNIHISTSKHSRQWILGLKKSHWPHLYRCYWQPEALACVMFEILEEFLF